MINAKQVVQTLLTGYAPLTALVPATNIRGSWPDSFTVMPQITHNIIDSFTADENYSDNSPNSDNVLMEIHVWVKPGQTVTPIVMALVDCMESGGWNRASYLELVDPDTKLMHVVTRWNKVLYR